jgi:hypothetical protein
MFCDDPLIYVFCPEPGLAELTFGPGLSAFPGLNLDLPSVAYSQE